MLLSTTPAYSYLLILKQTIFYKTFIAADVCVKVLYLRLISEQKYPKYNNIIIN